MKAFIYRMRSNVGYFSASMAIYAVIYLLLAYSRVKPHFDSNMVRCLDGIDPTIISGCICFAFFFVCAKRFTYDEAYLYGQSRKGALLSALASAAVYALLFAFYALGLALLVRRSVLSSAYLAVSADQYNISATEMFCNIVYITTVNLIAYEAANLLRKFGSWKFWVSLAVFVASFIVLYVFIVAIPQSKDPTRFDFWRASFATFIPQLTVMFFCDFFMSRGRQVR